MFLRIPAACDAAWPQPVRAWVCVSAADGRRLELTVQDTRVCGSTAQALLPSLLPLDQWAFPVARVFDTLSPYANTVSVTVTYLDEEMRVVRDEEGRPFVYARAE